MTRVKTEVIAKNSHHNGISCFADLFYFYRSHCIGILMVSHILLINSV